MKQLTYVCTNFLHDVLQMLLKNILIDIPITKKSRKQENMKLMNGIEQTTISAISLNIQFFDRMNTVN